MGHDGKGRQAPGPARSFVGIVLRTTLPLFVGILLVMRLAAATQAEEKREITGYGPFDFTRTSTSGEVEKAGGDRISAIREGSIYSYRTDDRFEGLIEFQRYHAQGKIPPARQSGYVPKINAAELRLEDGRLWLIILYFDPREFNDYLRVIKLEYGEPAVRPRTAKGQRRKAAWARGGNCIVLQQVSLDNTLNGGQLEIVKDHCSDLEKR